MQNTPRFDNFPPIRGILLDVDGTLLDSNVAHAAAWAQALGEHGIHVPPALVQPLVGMGGDRILRAVCEREPDPELAARIQTRRGELFRERWLPSLRPLPHVRELVLALRRRGARIVVASSATRDDLPLLLEQAEVADLIDAHTSADDARASKPAPDIVLAALQRGGFPAAEALLVGDTPWDVESARRARVRSVALRCGGWPDTALDGAMAIFDDPADLLANLGRLPVGATAMPAAPPAP
ncbi:MAG: HAD family hydrolase [bacterium]|nr:HAD family hydrolase [bacterium]